MDAGSAVWTNFNMREKLQYLTNDKNMKGITTVIGLRKRGNERGRKWRRNETDTHTHSQEIRDLDIDYIYRYKIHIHTHRYI